MENLQELQLLCVTHNLQQYVTIPPLEIDSIRTLISTCHKETQTSNTSLKDSGTATISDGGSGSNKGSLKVFEFSELVQNPKRPREITIIKDIFAEEIHDHNDSSGSTSDEAISNRYTYCREVIKPYLKDYPKDCPLSDDQLIRDALDAAHEDFPDYEPCFEGYDGNSKDDTEKRRRQSGNDTLEIKDSILHTFGKKEKENTPENKNSVVSFFGVKEDSFNSGVSPKHKQASKTSVASDDIKTVKSSNSSTETLRSNMDPDKVCPTEKPKDPRCPVSKNKPYPPSSEPYPRGKDEPGPPDICSSRPRTAEGTSCRNRPKIETCEDKPMKKKDPCEETSNNMEEACRRSVIGARKSIVETHNETLATIKSAVNDFFGKVYQSTKGAVTVLKTESAKHLGRLTSKKSDTGGSEMLPQRVHEKKSTDILSNFNFFRSTDNQDVRSQDSDDEDSILGKTEQSVGKIFNEIDSTISMLDKVDLEKMASLIRFGPKDASSPYDEVTSNDNDAAASTAIPNSVFTAIRSKIVSMFTENENQVKQLSNKSSESSNLSTERSEDGLKFNPLKK